MPGDFESLKDDPYRSLLADALKLARSKDASHLPGWPGKT
jgi:hypothetical protein